MVSCESRNLDSLSSWEAAEQDILSPLLAGTQHPLRLSPALSALGYHTWACCFREGGYLQVVTIQFLLCPNLWWTSAKVDEILWGMVVVR